MTTIEKMEAAAKLPTLLAKTLCSAHVETKARQKARRNQGSARMAPRRLRPAPEGLCLRLPQAPASLGQ